MCVQEAILLALNVNTHHSTVIGMMRSIHLGEYFRRVHACILSQGARNDLKRLGKLLDGVLV